MAVFCSTLLFPILVCQFFDVSNRPFLKSEDPVIKFEELNKLLSLWALHSVLRPHTFSDTLDRLQCLFRLILWIESLNEPMLVDVLMGVGHTESTGTRGLSARCQWSLVVGFPVGACKETWGSWTLRLYLINNIVILFIFTHSWVFINNQSIFWHRSTCENFREPSLLDNFILYIILTRANIRL